MKEKIRTALCSYGTSGRYFHAPFLQLHSSFDLVGAWERSSNLIQQDYPHLKSYDSFEELISDDIDLVIVNTPTSSHYEFAKEALMNDKHIIVEKAFTTSVGEASALQFLAEQQEKKLAIYHNRRWDSDFLTVKKIIDDGLLGDIYEVEFRFEKFNKELSKKQHKESHGPGAGIVYDLGPHLIDQALCLFGMPNKIFANLRMIRPKTKVDDDFEIVLYYNNLRVRLKASYMIHETVAAYQIHGKNGSFIKNRSDKQEQLLREGKKPNLTNWAAENKEDYGTLKYSKGEKLIDEKIKSVNGNYYHFFDAMYQSIIYNTIEPITATDGLNCMKIIEAVFESNKQEKIIVL